MSDREHWTPKQVIDRLEEAAKTLRRLPETGPMGLRASWPEVLHDYWDAYGWSKAKTRLGPPSPDAIDRMDECFEWLRWLEPDAAKLVWARACRVNWKIICAKRGEHRSTAWRYWSVAILKIATKLEDPSWRRSAA
ncbi:DUF6362 family protein [Magnetofaba australis]|uniref:DUF6362 family protein n=1 Tax=Magnetofaba australis TaxID=1472297 RepID=UPI000A19BE56|nr:DUF6362 family protein [Magnetofaba australis]